MNERSRILFSHSYFLQFDPKQWKTRQPYPPLGTLYAAALMREEGYRVSLFDTMFENNPETLIEQLEKYQPTYFVIYDDGFNYLTKMCLTNMREAAFHMCKLAKQQGCIVIVSGSDATDRYEQYLNEGADFVLLGEAEMTLKELINAIETGDNSYASIQGLAFKSNDEIIKTSRRSVLRFLDGLPFPAWDILDIKPYKEMWQKSTGYFSINMATTRGCPFKCNWCAKPIYGNRYNSRTPENVVQEIKILKEKFLFEHIWFCDDIFGLKPDWVHQFANLIEKEKLQFGFKIQSRADLLLQKDYIADLARAGCDNIWMGAESGSQSILDAMDKGTTITQIEESTELIKSYNMKPSFFIQFGYLGETMSDIKMTIDMINRLQPYSIGISISYPLPGTIFFEKVKNDLKEKTNWTDSDEMNMMFRNTYKPSFYKHLHGYVHASFQKTMSIRAWKNLFQHPVIAIHQWKKLLKAPYYVLDEFFKRKTLQELAV